jgi:hypothetical protein
MEGGAIDGAGGGPTGGTNEETAAAVTRGSMAGHSASAAGQSSRPITAGSDRPDHDENSSTTESPPGRGGTAQALAGARAEGRSDHEPRPPGANLYRRWPTTLAAAAVTFFHVSSKKSPKVTTDRPDLGERPPLGSSQGPRCPPPRSSYPPRAPRTMIPPPPDARAVETAVRKAGGTAQRFPA